MNSFRKLISKRVKFAVHAQHGVIREFAELFAVSLSKLTGQTRIQDLVSVKFPYEKFLADKTGRPDFSSIKDDKVLAQVIAMLIGEMGNNFGQDFTDQKIKNTLQPLSEVFTQTELSHLISLIPSPYIEHERLLYLSREELIKVNEELRKLDKMKTEFVMVAAHQLRTPITGIKWAFKAMLEKEFGPLSPEQQKVAEGGLQTSLNMVDLINDLLNTARIEEGKFGLTLSEQSFSKILEFAVESQKLEAKSAGVDISLSIDPILPLLKFDRGKMAIALDNIIDNAVKYTPAKGKVTVTVSADLGGVKLEIKDTGIGIPKDQMNRVFSKFFRAPNASRVFTSGSGLGLYIAKNIIEAHGGTISIKSTEGLGTTVTVMLPKAK